MKAGEHRPEVRLTGIAAAPGVARGPAYPLMRGMAIVACEKVADPEAEIRRLEGALAATVQPAVKIDLKMGVSPVSIRRVTGVHAGRCCAAM